MHGIADGANANGAKWLNRKLDLTDIVVANTEVEMGELRGAVGMTPTGLEGLNFDPPSYAQPKKDSPNDHCSAFAATGPATRDGKMISATSPSGIRRSPNRPTSSSIISRKAATGC